MRKSLFSLAPIAVLMMAISAPTQAANNAEITVTGNVSHGTCDVKLSQTMLSLGNFTADDFPITAKDPVAGSEKTFKVGLENCSLLSSAAKDGTAALIVTGSNVELHQDMFNSDIKSTTGIQLKDGSNVVGNGDKVTMRKFAGGGTDDASAGAINGLTKDFTVALVANTADKAAITGGMVSAPITFMYDYN